MGYAQDNVDIMSFALWISRGSADAECESFTSGTASVGMACGGWPARPYRRGGVGPARKGRGNGGVSHNFIFIFL
jgi:hypothetical protein